jgi:hypothetical protein
MNIKLTTRRFLLAALAVAPACGCATNEPAATDLRGPVRVSEHAAASPASAGSGGPVAASSARDPLREHVEAMRADLSRGKVGVFNDVMRLDAAEAKKFWPIYSDYEEELFALGDQRLELTRRYVQAHAAGKLDDKAAGEIAKGWLDYQAQSVELNRKYHGIIAAELSPVRAGQFLQIEHRVATVIDLMIASDLPLVRPSPTATGDAR